MRVLTIIAMVLLSGCHDDPKEIYPVVNGEYLDRLFYKCEFGVLVRAGVDEPILDINEKRIPCESRRKPHDTP